MPLRGDEYDARFARFEAEGNYLHGEADLVTGLLGEPPATVLDAGCGTGRVAIELARRGFDTLGIDVEQSMLDAARPRRLTWTGSWGISRAHCSPMPISTWSSRPGM